MFTRALIGISSPCLSREELSVLVSIDAQKDNLDSGIWFKPRDVAVVVTVYVSA